MQQPPTHILRLADLPARKPTRVTLEPDALARAALAEALGIAGLKRMRLDATLSPVAGGDWRLTADLGATAVQDCVVTLAPVTTRIDTPLTRLYMADWHDPEGAETEMPADTEAEPLPATLDLYGVALEALALALPDYPRAEGAELAGAQAAPEGVTPLRDADLKPFAGLAGLRDKLGKDEA